MPSPNDSPTIPTPQPQYVPPAQWQSPQTQPAPLQPQYVPPAQQVAAPQPGSMQSTGTSLESNSRRLKRRWPLRVLITLIVLAVLLTGGWFLAGRPILHSIAQNQFDQLVASQINTIVPLPTAFTALAISENQLNNLITLNHAPSDPVQNAVAHVTPPLIASDGSYTGGVRMDFQLFGFACSITAIPVATSGQIVMTHVQVNGILGWVMSSDEMTTLLNKDLQDVVARLHRHVTGIVLKNQEVDIQLGSAFL
jgi:hypothetical protein